jgi:hypothetical protein
MRICLSADGAGMLTTPPALPAPPPTFVLLRSEFIWMPEVEQLAQLAQLPQLAPSAPGASPGNSGDRKGCGTGCGPSGSASVLA